MNNDKYWIDGLNPEQEASAIKRGHVCVVARAGTGKTKGIVARVMDQIMGENKSANRMIMFTFTNMAANEMKKRLAEKECPIPYFTGTFHSVCMKLMFKFPFLRGSYRTENALLLDDEKVRILIRDNIFPNISEEDRNYMENIVGGVENLPKLSTLTKKFAEGISVLKSGMITPEDLQNNVTLPLWINTLIKDNPVIEFLIYKYYQEYENTLERMDLMDFNDIINIPVKVLESSDSMREIVSRHFDTILVDEHQDSNLAQVRLLDALSEYAELYTVGDDGQAIYGWRGADVRFIRDRMEEDNVYSISLFRNYRSSQTILDLANIILSYDTGVSEVKIQASGVNADLKDVPTMTEYNTINDELYGVGRHIQNLINDGEELSDIAVLCRTRALGTAVGNQLAKMAVPFKSTEFNLWESKDIKYIMAILSIADNPDHPGNITFLNPLLEGPLKYNIAKAGIEKLKEKALEIGFINALQETAKKKPKLTVILNIIEEIKPILHNRDLSDIISTIYFETYLREHIYTELKEIDGKLKKISRSSPLRGQLEDALESHQIRIQRIEEELLTAATNTNFDDLKTQSILGGQARKEDTMDAINVLTIHSAKGLEFKYVFLIGCTDSIMGTEDENAIDFGEACRTLYVAITRAEKGLFISYPSFHYGKMQKMSHLFEGIPRHILKYERSYRV